MSSTEHGILKKYCIPDTTPVKKDGFSTFPVIKLSKQVVLKNTSLFIPLLQVDV
jgi:hypothetical protein